MASGNDHYSLFLFLKYGIRVTKFVSVHIVKLDAFLQCCGSGFYLFKSGAGSSGPTLITGLKNKNNIVGFQHDCRYSTGNQLQHI
jgi:hypothetical protein